MFEELEITTAQARFADGLRRRWPGACVVSHERSWGVILEVRHADRVVDLLALRRDGGVSAYEPIRVSSTPASANG